MTDARPASRLCDTDLQSPRFVEELCESSNKHKLRGRAAHLTSIVPSEASSALCDKFAAVTGSRTPEAAAYTPTKS